MKACKFSLLVLLILALGILLGCSKKVILSDVGPPSISRDLPKIGEQKAADKLQAKPEPVSPDKTVKLERKTGVGEETLRAEDAREKALLEEAARKEAARQEALAREKELKKPALDSIYFDFDQWMIREDQKENMVKNAAWLKGKPQVKIRIEGNCDERGTTEYNLALGQKRAEAAKSFLEGLGIPPSRMQTVSYGEEHPLDLRHDEAAWAKNRRVDFIPIQ